MTDSPLLLRRLSQVEKNRLGVQSSVGPSGAAGPAGPSFQFPVGSVFIAVVATNPAKLLGYGTWTALAGGKVLIGNNGGTYPGGATGGAETKAISAHAGAAVADHAVITTSANDTALNRSVITTGTTAVAGDGHTHTVTMDAHAVTQPSAHTDLNVVQPYLVVWIWSRAS